MFSQNLLYKEINWFNILIFAVIMLPISFTLLLMSRHVINIVDGILLTPPI